MRTRLSDRVGACAYSDSAQLARKFALSAPHLGVLRRKLYIGAHCALNWAHRAIPIAHGAVTRRSTFGQIR